MDNARFDVLIHRYLNDEATEQERLELMQFINSDHYTEDLKKVMKEYYGKDLLSFDDERKEINLILSRAKAGENVTPVPESRFIAQRWWLAAAAILAFAMAVTYAYIRTKPSSDAIAIQQDDREVRIRGKQHVVLPDGSTVTMNENSELSYRQSYGEYQREVYLKGEAYFNIKSDKLHAFVVHTGGVQTQVLGTEFNVKANNKTDVVVTVYKGSVQVLDNMHEVALLTRNQQITVDQLTHTFKKVNVNAEEFLDWKSNYLIMDNISMMDAAQMIEVKYNVTVVMDDAMKNCIVKLGFFNNENLSEVLTVMSAVAGGTYSWKGKIVILTGQGCK